MQNHALARWRAHEKSIGAWLTMSDLYSAEILAQLGFDWVCFDLQHGLMDYSHLTHLLPAVAQWKFTPAMKNGRAVSADVVLPIELVDGPAS